MYKKKSSTCNNNATTTVDNGTMTDNQNKETDSKTEIKNKEHVELVASFVERDENVQCLNVIVVHGIWHHYTSVCEQQSRNSDDTQIQLYSKCK